MLTFTSNELEHVAEDELVTIIPTFNSERKLNLIQGDFGPFKATKPTDVPLWLATYYKKKGRCKIRFPDWLDYDTLNEAFTFERTHPDQFYPQLPFHYMEFSNLLLLHAKDDLQEPEKVRGLLADLQSIRFDKIQNILQNIPQELQQKKVVSLTGLGSLELNCIRNFA